MPKHPRAPGDPRVARPPDFSWSGFALRYPATPAAEVDAALAGLGAMARHVMKRRGLWSGPPAWLGYEGGRRWRDDEAWRSLVVDLFIEAVLEPAGALQAHAARGAVIDGMIWQNVYHFVTERQRCHDRVGYAIFGSVCAALLALAERRAVFLRGSGPRGEVHNRTLVRFDPDAPRTAESTRDELRQALGAGPGWHDAVRDMVLEASAARGSLAGHVAALASRGVRAFRVKALVDAVKRDVRPLHAALIDDAVTPRDDVLGLPAQWATVAAAVPLAIERSDHRAELRRDLLSLFDECVRAIDAGGDAPTAADLARLLGRPRGTVVYHLGLLGQIVKALEAGAP